MSDATHSISLTLLGQYAAAGFAASADQNGGAIVTFNPNAISTAETTLTKPAV